MAKLQEHTERNYLTVKSDGLIHKEVQSDTPGAVRREYETKDGTKGVKYEHLYDNIVGKIDNIEIYEGEYGKSLIVTFAPDTPEDQEIKLALSMNSGFGENFLRRLPNANLDMEMTVTPYSIENEGGRMNQGISLKQNGEKLPDFFRKKNEDGTWQNLNGLPLPDGDTTKYDSEDWKVFFIKQRKFVLRYFEANIQPRFASKQGKIQPKRGIEYPEEEINPEDIPFD